MALLAQVPVKQHQNLFTARDLRGFGDRKPIQYVSSKWFLKYGKTKWKCIRFRSKSSDLRPAVWVLRLEKGLNVIPTSKLSGYRISVPSSDQSWSPERLFLCVGTASAYGVQPRRNRSVSLGTPGFDLRVGIAARLSEISQFPLARNSYMGIFLQAVDWGNVEVRVKDMENSVRSLGGWLKGGLGVQYNSV